MAGNHRRCHRRRETELGFEAVKGFLLSEHGLSVELMLVGL
jgi:hypothetical protein